MTDLEIVKVIEAKIAGETILCKHKKGHVWSIHENPSWNFHDFDYMVAKKDERVPFDYTNDLVGKVVYHNKHRCKQLIISQNETQVRLGDGIFINYDSLLKYFTFKNGDPCGKTVKK